MQFDVGHIQYIAVNDFHQSQLGKNTDGFFHNAKRLTSDGRDHLRCVWDLVVEKQFSIVLQRQAIEFEKQVDVQRAVLHAF